MSNITINGVPGLDGIDFELTSPLNLIPDQPFPEEAFNDGEISVSSIKASANKKFTLGNDAKSVEFAADGKGFSALGVYRSPEKLLNALKREGLSEPMANLMNLKITGMENLLALRWGYDFDAGVKGKVALAPLVPGLSLNFGASGQTAGLSVLLHTQNRADSVADSIKGTLQSWRVPRQVKSIENLKPKTTVLYETMGKLGVSLGVEYGYDFSWTRDEIKIGALSGDLSLKIEMAIKAQFGFSATGLYALALSRESDDGKIRVQVFRLKQKDWSFAFDGAINSQFDKVPIPDNIDDFIKGVFNLNGSQILKDFEKFLDPDAKLENLISEELVGYARDLVKKVTGIDPVAAAEEAIEKFKQLIAKWHELPHEIDALIYGFLSKSVDLKGLKTFLAKITEFADDPKKIAAEITKNLQGDFFNSPTGKWLTAVSEQGLVSLLANIETEREKLVGLAEKTLGLLDGGAVEQMLKELQKWIDEKLHLDKIVNLNPDEWLKKRLADFLGKQTVVMDELRQIRDAINKLREKSAEFYKKGYDALMAKYTFEVHYAFHRTTHKDSLIDITLDFSGANLKSAETCLAEVLDGDFSRLLSEKINCLTINKAVFTHEIKRTTHLDVGLPYYKAFVDHINEAAASGKIVERDGDRLWVFSLSAVDILKKRRSLSKLSIEAELTESSEVRKFSEESYKTSYKFQYAKKGAKREYLKTRYKLAVDEYLRSAVPSYSDYLDELDRYLDNFGLPGANKFGNLLTSLEVSIPGKVISAWKNLPENPDDIFYQKMSFAVQRRLRQWIPVAYIEDEDKYNDTDDIYPLLVYMSLPLFAKQMDPNDHDDVDNRVYYWDYDKNSVQKQVFESHCRSKLLSEVLPKVREATTNPAYDNSKIDRIKDFNASKFETLCGLEKNIIKSIAKTSKAYLDFRHTPVTDPEKKIKALAEFGKEFTDTFNDDLGHIFYTPKGALRPLGLILIKDISELLDPNLGAVGFTTMLEMLILKTNISNDDFDKAKKKFFDGELPTGEETILQQRMVNIQI